MANGTAKRWRGRAGAGPGLYRSSKFDVDSDSWPHRSGSSRRVLTHPTLGLHLDCMEYIEDFSDERLKAWCIQCGAPGHRVVLTRDHVPSKSLLSKEVVAAGAEFDRGQGGSADYLPHVAICKECNLGFAKDESYLKCVLHAVLAGSLRPHPDRHPEAAKYLRSNRHFVRELEADPRNQPGLFADTEPFALYPDMTRIEHVVVKNARGHAYHEIGEPLMDEPADVWIRPITLLSSAERGEFERAGSLGLDLWPEVGSRMLARVVSGEGLANGGWIEVEPARYRYALDWGDGITVRTLIWDYLATRVRWGT